MGFVVNIQASSLLQATCSMFFALLSLLLQALPGQLDYQVLLASLDRPGGLDFLDSAVLQDLLDFRAHLDRQERPERLALPVDREALVDLVRNFALLPCLLHCASAYDRLL